MDPNQLLEDLRELVRDINADNAADLPLNASQAVGLAGGFADLDDWLSRGGSPPQQWNPSQEPHYVPGEHS